ncbi:methionine ABC transporter substrate-binding protein [Heyndrickxia shackletonii]|uniref:Lipoprotein n=1 Tax=Heyndrickxia shackletonii TaxID=157838 RepID=A0A0Q3WXH9_9BACI|nr:MetQ/NlpA family ABC transporter substrate-binding protein [Heyndrickxia shackletonii]KQL53179.1 methionine ABC transporter substrate-binding protein [Heyndrickxia shackletonii]NEZ00632.1 MetQ/NlpA family ABC transporter substrate-binding protein [Heyndrickxia shackletonii]
MKKWLGIFIASLLIVSLAACGTKNSSSNSDTKLVVGASNTPHAVILEKAKPILKKKGIDLQIEKYTDYVIPNKALDSGELDANYFQHIPYLNLQMKENGYKFAIAGKIHIEPMGVYSKKYKSLKDLPNGAKIIMSNSVADHGRILSLFEANGLIKLKPGIDKTKATLKDIADNPKHLKFEYNYEPALLTTLYKQGEGDAVVINSNFAIDAGLNPLKDSIAIEGKESPYVNVIAVRKGDENKKAIKTLVDVLHSKEIQDFILKEWKGAVVPVK